MKMERLLNDALLPFLNENRPGNVQPAGVVQLMVEDVKDKALFDVVDTRHMGLPVVRDFGKGHASYLNDKRVHNLKVLLYEDFMNALGDVAKGRRRPDLMVYTTDSDSYFIIHELSIGSSTNKRQDGKHQLGNTVQLLNRVPVIKEYLAAFSHRLCILSGADGAVNTPDGIADAFSEIYRQVAEPEPLNCALCRNGGFEAYITHNVVLK